MTLVARAQTATLLSALLPRSKGTVKSIYTLLASSRKLFHTHHMAQTTRSFHSGTRLLQSGSRLVNERIPFPRVLLITSNGENRGIHFSSHVACEKG